jgi:hypothetical protein
LAALALAAVPALAAAGNAGAADGQLCIPVEFVLFGLTLLGVALLHRHTLQVALAGLAVITAFKLGVTGFHQGPGIAGLMGHLGHEWVMLANLLGLLLGFALLARHFEDSKVPEILPRFLPSGWQGGLVLLVMIFVLSSFLDNIAAALIGGTVALIVFRRKVHIGYLAAIVAASNAGGSGSVVGDTTTTMMWISGVSPLDVLHAAAPLLPGGQGRSRRCRHRLAQARDRRPDPGGGGGRQCDGESPLPPGRRHRALPGPGGLGGDPGHLRCPQARVESLA